MSSRHEIVAPLRRANAESVSRESAFSRPLPNRTKIPKKVPRPGRPRGSPSSSR